MKIKNLLEAKEKVNQIIKWCNDNDDYTGAEALELYLHCLKKLAVRGVKHVIDLDGDYVRENFDSWSEYLMENFGINYEDFITLTDCELSDIFTNE